MRYQQKITDGTARIGLLTTADISVSTPAILYLKTKHINPPTFATSIIRKAETKSKSDQFTICIGQSSFHLSKTSCQKHPYLESYLLYPKDMNNIFHQNSISYSHKNDSGQILLVPGSIEGLSYLQSKNNTMIYIVGSAQQLFKQTTLFIEYITTLKKLINVENLLYLPTIAEPSTLALLTYLGIDFFDASLAILAANDQTFLFPTGNIHQTQLTHLPCSCPACVNKKESKEMEFKDILSHNYYAFENELNLIRNAIRNQTLRELVEQRARVHPHLASLLHILDRKKFSYIEQFTATQRNKTLITTTNDGLFRPEVQRFRQRVLNRYQPPAHGTVLLLLPCSAKKPYSFSKSHRSFLQIIKSLRNPWCIHEMIITSPLGLVPRELELIYPASSYDIAVSGHWYEDEKQIILSQFKQYLKQHNYDHIVIHLPENLHSFISPLFDHPICTTKTDHPTAAKSLSTLSNTLKKISNQQDQVSSLIRKKENMQALASYQFGPKSADILLKNTKIKGKYPYYRIMDETKNQLGMIQPNRGFVSLTLDGGKRIASSNRYWVQIADDFTLKGSVFAPGVINADPIIRKGDEVIVIQADELQGVGVAQMNAREMKTCSHGESVKMRHIIH